MLILTEKPKLNLDSLFGAKEIRIRAGEPLNINLGVSGTPQPTADWSRNGRSIPNNVSRLLYINRCMDNSMYLEDQRPTEYSCQC